MRAVLSFLMFSACVLLAGCNASNVDRSAVDELALDFQTEFNRENYQGIYAKSAPGMKAAIQEAEFEKALGTVKTVLGRMERHEFVDLANTKSTAGEDLVMARYQTTFEHGVGEQVYFMSRDGSRYVLFQWNINSDDLIKGMVGKISG